MLDLKGKPILSFFIKLAAGIVFIVLLALLVKFSAKHATSTNLEEQKIGNIESRFDLSNTSLYK